MHIIPISREYEPSASIRTHLANSFLPLLYLRPTYRCIIAITLYRISLTAIPTRVFMKIYNMSECLDDRNKKDSPVPNATKYRIGALTTEVLYIVFMHMRMFIHVYLFI